MLSLPKERCLVDTGDYVEEITTHMSTTWEKAQSQVKRAQKKQKQQHDKHAHPATFSSGDRVFVYMPAKTTGKTQKFAGSVVLANMSVRVLWNRSTSPSVCGWYAVVFVFFTPSNRYTSNISDDKKAVPRSESSSDGTPWRGTTSVTSNFAIVKAVWSSAGNASGHFVR